MRATDRLKSTVVCCHSRPTDFDPKRELGDLSVVTGKAVCYRSDSVAKRRQRLQAELILTRNHASSLMVRRWRRVLACTAKMYIF